MPKTWGRMSSGNYRGYAEINYAKIMNPNIAVQKIDHSYFSQDLFENMYKRYLQEGKVWTESYYGPFVKALNPFINYKN